jgi:hypothetical protein
MVAGGAFLLLGIPILGDFHKFLNRYCATFEKPGLGLGNSRHSIWKMP